ncbi:hypothetical protein [Streptomyces lincolnensis]|nr:hypothetical protein [Streptomyces lincolnensis]
MSTGAEVLFAALWSLGWAATVLAWLPWRGRRAPRRHALRGPS